jgi:hypothetical protein
MRYGVDHLVACCGDTSSSVELNGAFLSFDGSGWNLFNQA